MFGSSPFWFLRSAWATVFSKGCKMGQYETTDATDLQELLRRYNEVLGQLGAFKHIICASTLLTDSESVAVLFSRQMRECIGSGSNSLWLASDSGKVAEVARNGELISLADRKEIMIDSVEAVRRAMREQPVIRGAEYGPLQILFPTFQAPDLFPIKTHNEAIGFIAVDQVDASKREEYQFIAQFIGLILRISKLHEEVSSQGHTLDQERYRQTLERLHAESVEKNRELEELNAVIIRQTEQIIGINQVIHRLSKAVNLNETCEAMLTALRDHMSVRKVILFLRGENDDCRLVKHMGLPALESRDLLPLFMKDEVSRMVLRSGRRLGKAGLKDKYCCWNEWFDNWTVWPLKGQRGILGLFIIEDPGPELGDTLGILVGQGGVFLETAMLHEEMLSINTQLMEAHTRLMHVDRQKSEFLKMVGHDLRTPLTSIRSSSELLLMYQEESTQIREEFLEIINRESIRLENLINGFLDFARLESGTMEYAKSPVAVDELIHHCAALYEGEVSRRKIAFSVEVEPHLPEVLGDRSRILQVLSSLLSNAVKFSPDGGSIRMWARQRSFGAPTGPWNGTRPSIEIGVSDRGPGIDFKYHHVIFDRFGQVGDRYMKAKGGTGLGLAIAREIVEHHGGCIWVESEPGKGASFIFVLPLPVQ